MGNSLSSTAASTAQTATAQPSPSAKPIRTRPPRPLPPPPSVRCKQLSSTDLADCPVLGHFVLLDAQIHYSREVPQDEPFVESIDRSPFARGRYVPFDNGDGIDQSDKLKIYLFIAVEDPDAPPIRKEFVHAPPINWYDRQAIAILNCWAAAAWKEKNESDAKAGRNTGL